MAKQLKDVRHDKTVREQRGKLEQLQERRTALLAQAAELRGQLGQGGETVSTAVAEPLADDEQVQLQRSLEQDLRATDEALAIQRQRLQRAESTVANQVRNALLPEHQTLAANIANALRQLDQAMQAERDFRETFSDHYGCSFSIGPMISVEFEPLRVNRDGGSRLIHDYLQRLEQHGYPSGDDRAQAQ